MNNLSKGYSMKTKIKALLAVLLLSAATLLPAIPAQAAALTQAGVRLGRLGISASSNNDVLVTLKLLTTPTSVAKIDLVFPVGFTVANGTPTLGSTFPLTPGSITALPGTLTATATSATRDIQITGITSASLSGSTLYGFVIPTGTVTNPGSAGQYVTTVCSENASGTAGCATNTIDTSSVPVYIYGAGANADQIAVTASVAGNFSFSLSANTDTIPQVDPTTIQTSSGVNMTVATNSGLGFTAYVKSANAQLTSTNNPGTPIANGTFNAAPDTFTAGTSKYGFVPTTGSAGATVSGSITYDLEYAGLTGTTGGAFNGTAFSSFVSRSGYTSGDIISLKERVTVANTIAAATDYTDTLTIVAAGNY
jgi:hypothetical protein